MSQKKYDVTALGEILIDFTFAGVTESGTRLFEQNPGGAPANVLSAVTRLGGKTAFIGKIGKDMHGEFLRDTLAANGIDARALKETDGAFTTLAFVALDEKGDRSFSFARKPGADTQLRADELDEETVASSKIFHVGSLSLTDEPARSATLSALHIAKQNGLMISYDPNYRAGLWSSREAAVEGMKLPLPFVDMIKISDEEGVLLTGEASAEGAAKFFLEAGISCVLVTMGEKGAYVAGRAGAVYSPTFASDVVDTTGAGDSFMGAFLYRVACCGKHPRELSTKELADFARFANAAAALCVGRRGGINAMPEHAEVEALLARC